MDLWKRWDLILACAKTSSTLAKIGQGSAALENCRKTETLLRDTTDDPTNVWLRNYRADAFSDLGEALKLIASYETVSINQQRERWIDARNSYQHSLDIWQDMRREGKLSSAETSKFDKVTREILACNKALAK